MLAHREGDMGPIDMGPIDMSLTDGSDESARASRRKDADDAAADYDGEVTTPRGANAVHISVQTKLRRVQACLVFSVLDDLQR